ncbi:hypothetical protein EVAR_6014_1 [Eumeta japonica]|uniref:Uncharacterized protein n=1 Tax=Eumeta variegata TaxID=151549 RepID=A0A4C1T9I6_EUMVA|nr:hypothetical protein EVAR_6014_1 [Eumeta japonica]
MSLPHVRCLLPSICRNAYAQWCVPAGMLVLRLRLRLKPSRTTSKRMCTPKEKVTPYIRKKNNNNDIKLRKEDYECEFRWPSPPPSPYNLSPSTPSLSIGVLPPAYIIPTQETSTVLVTLPESRVFMGSIDHLYSGSDDGAGKWPQELRYKMTHLHRICAPLIHLDEYFGPKWRDKHRIRMQKSRENESTEKRALRTDDDRKRERPGTIGGVDKEYSKNCEKRGENARFQRSLHREKVTLNPARKLILSSSPSSSDYECKSSTSEISVKAGPSTANLEVPPKRKRGRKNIFDERLSASLDFAKLSDRKATVVLTSTLKVQPNTPLTVHWDGKLIEDITGHKTVDRLPILVSGQGVDQLWLSQNSVMELGRRVLQLFMTLLFLGTWATKSNVLLRHHCGQYRFKSRCLHFIRTEDRKDALWLACRHHIMEIVLEAVVVQALGPSSGPEILIFKRFRSAWPSIDQHFYNPGNSVYISTKEPRLWEEDEDYKASREIVRSMRVVNDIAERGVALIEEFNKIITSDEEQNNSFFWL